MSHMLLPWCPCLDVQQMPNIMLSKPCHLRDMFGNYCFLLFCCCCFFVCFILFLFSGFCFFFLKISHVLFNNTGLKCSTKVSYQPLPKLYLVLWRSGSIVIMTRSILLQKHNLLTEFKICPYLEKAYLFLTLKIIHI